MRQPDGATPLNPGCFIYVGLAMSHFGHALLEGVSRLWFIRANPDMPILWHDIALPVPHSLWPSWWDELWQMPVLDRHVHHAIRQPARFAKIVVPRPGLTIGETLHLAQARRYKG